jgi:hypothetical protein
VADIVAREKQLRRPVRFEEWLVASAMLVDLVFIGIQHVQAGVTIKLADNLV